MNIAVERWQPEIYAMNSGVQHDYAIDQFKKHFFLGTERVLDLGCGDGYVTNIIANQVPGGSVIGLDSSESMVAYASQNYTEGKNKNLRFMVGNVKNFSCNKKFDMIVSFSCLHWIKNIENVFSNIKNSLVKNGYFKAVLYPECKYQTLAIEKCIRNPKWIEYFMGFETPHCFYDTMFLKEELDRCGFSSASVTLTDNSVVSFENINGLMGFINGWLPHLSVLPEDKRNDFLLEMSSQYAKSHGYNGDGEVRIALRKIEINAKA